VVDGRRGVGNGCVFPAGPLRAPLKPQLRRAHAVLVIGPIEGASEIVTAVKARGLPVFHGHLEPDAAALAALQGRKVLAFAGIGDPEKFFATLAASGIEVAERKAFPDHHRYRKDEAADLIARAEAQGLTLVTTEKDMARMAGEPDLAALAAAACTLPVTLRVVEEAAFRELVLSKVN
jgi:tetraacyldisaccharide 4'-kinase